jgi:hypothetical protein
MAPRLPKALWSSLGPLGVSLEDRLEDNALGMFTYRPRDIKIDNTGVPAIQWATFWHEVTHVALFDSGVSNCLNNELEEAVCDAVGTYLAGMTLAGCLTVRAPKE